MQEKNNIPQGQTLEFSTATNLLEQSAYKYQLQDRETPNLYRHLFDYESVPKVSFNHRYVPVNMPEEIWITDKLWPSEYADAYGAVNAMLDRLGVEYIDLVYLHHPAGDIETIVSVWQGLERAYREGKIRALGISNFDNRMDAFNAIMEQEIRPQVMQIECHPFAQRLETRELAEQYGIQVECWYPLGHGDQRLLTEGTLEAIAQAHEKSVVQIIIRWHIQEGFSVIPGSTNPEHIRENLDVFDFELSDEEMEQIRAMDQGEDGRYFNINYDLMGGAFTSPPREWDGEF